MRNIGTVPVSFAMVQAGDTIVPPFFHDIIRSITLFVRRSGRAFFEGEGRGGEGGSGVGSLPHSRGSRAMNV